MVIMVVIFLIYSYFILLFFKKLNVRQWKCLSGAGSPEVGTES